MLLDLVPDFLVRAFARPYVAGDHLEDGLDVADHLWQQASIRTTLDLLAEEVTSIDRVQANRQTYEDMIRTIGRDRRFACPEDRPSVSVKLSSFTVDPMDRGGQASGSREAMEAVAELAREHQVPLTIDMEDHHWTSFTLEVACDLFRRGFDVGTVLQTRLHRTREDLAGIPEGMRIRLVIGIYPEPRTIAITDRNQMKQHLLDYAGELLQRDIYVELATHDSSYLQRFFREVISPASIAENRYEIQMLFGVPRADVLRRILAGTLPGGPQGAPSVRLYVPFATAWDQATAYCRRRLRSNPDIAIYVLRNLLASLRGQRPGITQYLST
jgi:proline dehydrogenase